MIRVYIRTAWRNIIKRKALSAINVTGLVVGLAVFLLINQYVIYEKGYDQDRQNLYRVTLTRIHNGQAPIQQALTFGALGTQLLQEVPSIRSVLRIAPKFGNPVFGYQNTYLVIPQWLFAESSVFPLMGVSLMKGNSGTALQKPYTIVISEQLAARFFGKTDPIGKTLQFGDLQVRRIFEVTGVLASRTTQSHLQFDALVSFATLSQFIPDVNQNWDWANFYTYVQLHPLVLQKQVEREMADVLSVHKGADLQKKGIQEVLHLQSVPDIHLHSRLQGEAGENANSRMISLVLLIAGFVVFLAWLNYINITTATYNERAREIGVRKVIGASSFNLVAQLLVESFLLFGISALLALMFAEGLLTAFAHVMGKPLPSLVNGSNSRWSFLFGYTIAGTLLAGLYPAFALSSRNPINMLKSQASQFSRGGRFRQTLVVFQFTVSILFIIATVVIHQQIIFLKNKDTGIRSDGVIIINAPSIQQSDTSYLQDVAYFKEKAKSSLNVVSVTASSSIPGKSLNLADWHKEGTDPNQAISFRVVHVDADYAEAYQLSFLAGQNFTPLVNGRHQAVLLNEVAAHQLGYLKPADAVGKRLTFDGELYTVYGVIRNFNYASLRELVEPLALVYNPTTQTYFSVRTGSADLTATLTHLQNLYHEIFTGNPFSYAFLDESLNAQYQAESRFGQLVGTLSAIAIIIACLGLFGLTIFSISKRTKEIGVRKVLGASVAGVVTLLSKDLVKLVLVAIVIASPIAWWAMHRWLQEFAYRVNIEWWVFTLAGLLAVLIALLTVSFQAIKAAVANPVKSLRTE